MSCKSFVCCISFLGTFNFHCLKYQLINKTVEKYQLIKYLDVYMTYFPHCGLVSNIWAILISNIPFFIIWFISVIGWSCCTVNHDVKNCCVALNQDDPTRNHVTTTNLAWLLANVSTGICWIEMILKERIKLGCHHWKRKLTY